MKLTNDSGLQTRSLRCLFAYGVAALLIVWAVPAHGTVTEPLSKTAWSHFGTSPNGPVTCPTMITITPPAVDRLPCAPMQTIKFNGHPVRDFEGSSDPTISTPPNDPGDIASGFIKGTPVACNPECPIGPNPLGTMLCTTPLNTCGTWPSVFHSYWYNLHGNLGELVPLGGSIAGLDQPMGWLFMRMRIVKNMVQGNSCDMVNGTNHGANCLFSSGHINHLLDIDNDGWKEFWVDIDGGGQRVRILYQDRPTNNVSNDCQAPGSTDVTKAQCNIAGGTQTNHTWVNTFKACVGDTVSTDCADHSITRAFPASAIGEGGGTDNWYVDVQIPMAALTKYNGDNPQSLTAPTVTWESLRSTTPALQFYPNPASYPLPQPLVGGAIPFAYNPYAGENPPSAIPAYLRFNFATSDSNVDPVQKDYILPCGYSNVSCSSDTTPVTLSSFKATPTANGFRFDWSTANELGNAGFEIWGSTPWGWAKLNADPIPSKGVDSLDPADYSLAVQGIDASAFRLVDVDTRGKERAHGPFQPDEQYGSKAVPVPADWTPIREESAAKARSRSETARALTKARSSEAASAAKKGVPPGLAGYPVMTLGVSEDGLYRATWEQLSEAGVDFAGVPAPLLSLTSRDGPVPLQVGCDDSKAAVFGPGCYVEFVGRAVRTQYTRKNVYRLSVNPKAAVAVRKDPVSAGKATPAASYLATVEVNEDKRWSFSSPYADPWYREQIQASKDPVSVSYPIALDNVVPAGGDAKVSVVLWGMTESPRPGIDHHVQAYLNGSLVGESRFRGYAGGDIVANVGTSLLRDGVNSLVVKLPFDLGHPWDYIAFDKVSIAYPRAFVAKEGRLDFTASAAAFKVTGLPSPSVVVYRETARGTEVLTGLAVSGTAGSYDVTFRGSDGAARYWVASGAALRSPELTPLPEVVDPATGTASYLVISHPDFIDGLAPLVAAREAQGYSVKVVDVRDVYQRFSGGVLDPAAIKSFVGFAAREMGTTHVLLVGADSFDYFDNYQVGSVSFIPTYYVRTDALVGFAPSDGVFGDLDGDLIADVAIGRFPVKTSAQLAAVVQKTLAYPSNPSLRKALFVADRSDGLDSYTDASEQAIARLGAGWQLDRAFIDTLGAGAARKALIDGINAGLGMTSFMGHSDYNIWSFENLFNTADVPALTNANAPTLVVQWGCWNTFFTHPWAVSLSDALMTSQGRGAAAVIGPSILSMYDGDRLMGNELAALVSTPGVTIGQALVTAKARVGATQPNFHDVLRGVNLMGDPALVVTP